MSTRKIDYIIEDARESSENNDFSDTIGIQDSEFLRFINDAQLRIHSLLVQQHPSVFLSESVVNATRDQEVYTLPVNTFVGNKVAQVEYSATQSDDDYYPLRPSSLFNRDKGSEGDPTHYIRKAGTILLKPVPNSTSGKLRITYTHKLPKIDKKRASVSSVTLATNSITDLAFNVSTDSIDSTVLNKDTRLSIVDEEGNVKMSNIKFTNIDTGTGIVTIDPAFVFEDGEIIESGDIVVSGRYSTTHSQLDEMVERYLISYCVFQILKRESNTDVQIQQMVLTTMENEIVDSYAELTDDIVEIPNIVSFDDEW